MNAIDIIRKKRNGADLLPAEIHFMVSSFTKGKIPDYQFSAFLMAVYFCGMTTPETAALTEAMLYSGKVIDLSELKGVKVDKHSTGGVGDKTSMILAPLVAAAGAVVPMISGRGLGHTGGTLDKLESIPGFRTSLSLAEYKKVLKNAGVVMIGQTADIAPADKVIYALRDVTCTVESIPLITASIMSKKLAEGIDALVLDVKTGSGAFMREFKDSVALAESLINTAKAFKKKVMALITDMNQPLGHAVGNWLEIAECARVLQGEWIDDLCEVTFSLSGAMLLLAGKAGSIEEGFEISKTLARSGKAFDVFVKMAEAQGGSAIPLKAPSRYPAAKYSTKLYSPGDGYFSAIDNYEAGMAALELGAGRLRKEDVIDFAAGYLFHPKLGDRLQKGQPIAELFSNSRQKLEAGRSRLERALTLSAVRPKKHTLIRKIMR